MISQSLTHIILVGGGLQSGLVALALADRGDCRVTLIERQAELGGEHTWCFFDTDLDGALVADH